MIPAVTKMAHLSFFGSSNALADDQVAIPVTFYLSEAIVADDHVSTERVADLLKKEVQTAIQCARDTLNAT